MNNCTPNADKLQIAVDYMDYPAMYQQLSAALVTAVDPAEIQYFDMLWNDACESIEPHRAPRMAAVLLSMIERLS
jgi:hypothetical protein